MSQENKEKCPTCQGEKTVKGTCECNEEWRGTQDGDNWEDCQCTPEQKCPTCDGKGFLD